MLYLSYKTYAFQIATMSNKRAIWSPESISDLERIVSTLDGGKFKVMLNLAENMKKKKWQQLARYWKEVHKMFLQQSNLIVTLGTVQIL